MLFAAFIIQTIWFTVRQITESLINYIYYFDEAFWLLPERWNNMRYCCLIKNHRRYSQKLYMGRDSSGSSYNFTSSQLIFSSSTITVLLSYVCWIWSLFARLDFFVHINRPTRNREGKEEKKNKSMLMKIQIRNGREAASFVCPTKKKRNEKEK